MGWNRRYPGIGRVNVVKTALPCVLGGGKKTPFRVVMSSNIAPDKLIEGLTSRHLTSSIGSISGSFLLFVALCGA